MGKKYFKDWIKFNEYSLTFLKENLIKSRLTFKFATLLPNILVMFLSSTTFVLLVDNIVIPIKKGGKRTCPLNGC